MRQSTQIPRDRSAPFLDVPAGEEIPITDEMIEEGVRALAYTDRRYDTDDVIVVRVYESMRKLAPDLENTSQVENSTTT